MILDAFDSTAIASEIACSGSGVHQMCQCICTAQSAQAWLRVDDRLGLR